MSRDLEDDTVITGQPGDAVVVRVTAALDVEHPHVLRAHVLALLAHGLTNTQIGAQLNISRATVKFHVSSILSKLGAASRTEAAALAVQHHLISGPE